MTLFALTLWNENGSQLKSINEKLDYVIEKVERHDEEIQEIKTHLHL
ncbi:MAG: hypothetical protein HQM15_07970 [Deltaproteobacteria bacterium]|nr:hypothetical protein [Deltaproteobacteria bacterium]